MATITVSERGGGNIVGMSNELTWDAARTAVTGETISTGDFMEATFVGAGNFNLRRSFMWFDTAAIGADSVITSAKLIHTAISNRTNDDTCTMHIVGQTGTDPTIVLADYDQSLTTSFGSVGLGSLNTGGSTDIALNATGIAAINKSGHTGLAIIFDRDKDNTDPTATNQYQANPTLHQLEVTFIPAATQNGYSFFM